MAEKMSVTIPLSERQKEQIRKATGKSISALKVESTGGVALARRLQSKALGKKMSPRALGRKLSARALGRKLSTRALGKRMSPRALGRAIQ